jgi:TatD DNase family protein
MFVDSHCHLDRLDYDKVGPLDQVLNSARNRGVERFLCIATHLDGYERVKTIAEQHDDVHCTAGVHPLQKTVADLDIDRLRQQAMNPQTIAVGETGLDYYYAAETAEGQRASFASHVDIAVEVNKPLIIHTRDAVDDTLAILREHSAEKAGGVLHCFTESYAMAKEALELDFYISFSGILTFKSAESLRMTAKKLPLDRILIETDCPWLAPVPYRGKENQPAYVVEVAQMLAELHDTSVEEIARLTTENFYRRFPLAQTA